MAEEQPNFRMERIEKLLHELRYEIERGLMDREIDEHMVYRFVFPRSNKIPDGVVLCEFRMRPAPAHSISLDIQPAGLRVVK